MPAFRHTTALLLTLLLTGCELLGIESPERIAARKESDGKAIGSACRHAMRAIEDCYRLNRRASKGAVFAGWREMDEYMRENKLAGVVPTRTKNSSESARHARKKGDDVKVVARASDEGEKGADEGAHH